MKKFGFVLATLTLFLALTAGFASALTISSPVDGQVVSGNTAFTFTPNVGMNTCSLYTRTSGSASFSLATTLNPAVGGSVNTINYNLGTSRKTLDWQINCSGTGPVDASTVQKLHVSQSKLVIDEIKVKYEEQGSSDTDSVSETYDFSDIASGKISISDIAQDSDVTITVYARNIYSTDLDSDDTVIEDATLEIESDDGDIEDASEDFDDIEAGDKESVKTTLTIPADLLEDDEDDDFDFTITVEGDDGNGNTQRDTLDLTLGVTKARYATAIKSLSLSNNVVSCDRSVTVSTRFSNVGYKDLDKTMLYIYSNDLGLAYVEKDIEMDSDSTEYQTREVPFTVKDSVAPGKYKIYMKLFQDNSESKQLDGGLAAIDLEVQKCVQQTTQTQQQAKNTTTVIVPPANTNVNVQTLPSTQTTKPSTSKNVAENDLMMIGLLASFNVILLLVGIFLIIKLVRK